MGDLDKRWRIAVVGGGIAGLGAAIMLRKQGFADVSVFERDEGFESRRQGYGLTIMQGISALKRLGLYESVLGIDSPSRTHFIFDKDGFIVGLFGTVFWDSWSLKIKKRDKHNLHVSRQGLRRILYDAWVEKGGLMYWNRRLICLDRDKERKWRLGFSDGAFFDADMIVACDGINSTVRKLMVNPHVEIPLRFLGVMVVLGISKLENILSGNIFETLDGCARIYVMPYEDGVMWQLSFGVCEEEAYGLVGNKEWLMEKISCLCQEWHSPIPELIRNTEMDLVMGIPVYDRDVPDWEENPLFSVDGVAFLGDAAHPMSPFKGQGANQALLDVAAFCEAIQNTRETMDNNIREFHRKSFDRVKSKVVKSRDRASSYHSVQALDPRRYLYEPITLEFIQGLAEKKITALTYGLEQIVVAEYMNVIGGGSGSDVCRSV